MMLSEEKGRDSPPDQNESSCSVERSIWIITTRCNLLSFHKIAEKMHYCSCGLWRLVLLPEQLHLLSGYSFHRCGLGSVDRENPSHGDGLPHHVPNLSLECGRHCHRPAACLHRRVGRLMWLRTLGWSC